MIDDPQLKLGLAPRERFQLDYWRPQIGATLDGLDLRWLAESRPVTRLKKIGFLGALTGGPVSSRSDNRYDHTLGAAYIAGLMGTRVGLPQDIIRHLVAAVLIHDTGNRALSHSCEGAFDAITGVSGKRLTESIITGEPGGVVPASYVIHSHLIAHGLDPDFILSVFHKDVNQPDDDKRLAVRLYSNPINPDTLDGILRAAHLLLAQYLNPVEVAQAFSRIGSEAAVPSAAVDLLDTFWRTKAATYQAHIHNADALLLERSFTEAALALYSNYTSIEIFKLSDPIVRRAVTGFLEDGSFRTQRLRDTPLDLFGADYFRFRTPRKYVIADMPLFSDHVTIEQFQQRYRSVSHQTNDSQ